MTFRQNNKKAQRGFTLIEILVVIAIISIIATILVTAVGPAIRTANAIKEVRNLQQVANATISFAADNNNKLPSPQYPGGHSNQPSQIPAQSDFLGIGSGLWLDGVVFYQVYGGQGLTSDTTNGQHLRGTVFASEQSFRETARGQSESAANWYEHSYAMNRDIQHDHLYDGLADSSLTNKTLANISDPSSCLLLIENADSNIIGVGDREAILQTGDERWKQRRVHAAFVDGSARKLEEDDIPSGGSDFESSRFWTGVDP